MSDSTGDLENHYLGDKAWNRFTDLAMKASPFLPTELVSACGGDQRLAAAVLLATGESALAWMDRKIPALGGRSASKCLESERLLRRLRSVLMRMP